MPSGNEPDLPVQFRTKIRVEFCDTDMAGIVHFSNFYRYMEKAEGEFFRSLGLTLVTRNEDGSAVGWPRVSSSCSFKAPTTYDDELDVAISVYRIGVKSLTMRFEFTRDDTLIAKGQVKTAYCLFKPGEPIQALEIPQTWSKMIENARPDAIES